MKPSYPPSSRERLLLIGLGFFAAIAVTAYWLAWFFAPNAVRSRAPGDADYALYVAFEQAFPLADGWLALTSLLGAIGLLRKRLWGYLASLLAGSAAVFLGLMDLLYDLEYGMFFPLTVESSLEMLIVLLTLVLGPLVIYLAWKQLRQQFFNVNSVNSG